MSAKTDIDQLVLLADDALNSRVEAAAARIETRIERAMDGGRDLTQREYELTQQDRDELVALRDATEIRSVRGDQSDRIEQETRDRAQLIGGVIETRGNLSPLFPSAENLARLEEARWQQSTLTLVKERAAIKTTDAGTAREYAPSGLLAPRGGCLRPTRRGHPAGITSRVLYGL
ncbi:MAG TPA: hypothetical protein VFC01_17620 [Mycobacterium sp.]|nr:hypothetical protein [Mycobacterium sp.]